MDEVFRKLIGPDARGTQGRLSRGNNIYKGGIPNPTPVGSNSRTGKPSSKTNPNDFYARLANLRLKGLI